MTTQQEDIDEIEDVLDTYSQRGTEYGPTRALEAFRRLFRRTWILCAERMPEDGADVFFFADQVYAGEFDAGGQGSFAAPEGYWNAGCVTHWMPRFVAEAPEAPRRNSNLSCLGRPEGFEGGELRFCEAPTKSGRRFCDRCQAIREASLRQRVTGLLAQYKRETAELQELIREGHFR